MLDVEHGVNRKIVAFLGGNTQSPQTFIYVSRARGRSHLNDTQRADRLEGVATVTSKRNHRVSQRKRLGHHRVWRRADLKMASKARKHGAVHPFSRSPAHLVPEISSHFQLC